MSTLQGEKLSAESLQAALSYRPTKKRLAKVNLTEARMGMASESGNLGKCAHQRCCAGSVSDC